MNASPARAKRTLMENGLKKGGAQNIGQLPLTLICATDQSVAFVFSRFENRTVLPAIQSLFRPQCFDIFDKVTLI